MRNFCLYALILLYAACFLAAAQTAEAAPQAGTYKCAKDASGILVCQRIAPADKISGYSGTYTDGSSGKLCKWKCKIDGRLETCKASGNECNNKLPPHWK